MKHSSATAPVLKTICNLSHLLPPSPPKNPLFLPFLAPAVLVRPVTTACYPRTPARRVAVKEPLPLSKRRTKPICQFTTRHLSAQAETSTAGTATLLPRKISIEESEIKPVIYYTLKEWDDFSEDEIEIARRTISTHQRNSDAFDRLFAKGIARFPGYSYPLLVPAIAHVQRQIRIVLAELEGVVDAIPRARAAQGYLDTLLRKRRMKGWKRIGCWTAEEKETLKEIYEKMPEIFTYLILERKTLRLARLVWKEYSQRRRHSFAPAVFDLLVAESLHVAKTPYEKAMAARSLLRALVGATKITGWGISQRTMYLLIIHVPPEDLAQLCFICRKRHIYLGQFTVFHLIHRLREDVIKPSAIKTIPADDTLREVYLLLDQFTPSTRCTPMYRIACYTLYYDAYRFMPQNPGFRKEVRMLLHDNQRIPPYVFYNFMFSHAVRERNVKMMKLVLDKLAAKQIKPSFIMQNSLHWYFKETGEEIKRLAMLEDRAREDSKAGNVPLADDYLRTDMIHAMVLQKAPYHTILEAYRRYFRDDILYKLGIGGPTLRDRHDPDLSLRKPNAPLIGIMYCRFLRSRPPQGSFEVWMAYLKYKRMLKDPEIGPLLIKLGDPIPFLFMEACAQYTHDQNKRLEYVSAILQDMLHRHSPVKPKAGHWSLVLRQLEVAGKMREAEMILEMMLERGMEPHSLVWTSLTRGYVREGDPYMAGDVLRRTIDAGREMSDIAALWVSRIEDKDEFMRGLNQEPSPTMGIDETHHNSQFSVGGDGLGDFDVDGFDAGDAGDASSKDSM